MRIKTSVFAVRGDEVVRKRRRGLIRLSPRRAVAATFAAFGMSMGVWNGASASVVEGIGLSATSFGLALTLFTACYLAAMSGAGVLASRIGVRRALLLALLTMGAALGLAIYSRSAGGLMATLSLFGAVGGLMDSTMNAEGARVEQDLGKPIFVQFHAMASGAVAAGALVGSFLAFQGAKGGAVGLAELGLLGAACAVAGAIKERPSDASRLKGASSLKGVDLGLAILGLAVGVSIVCEGSSLAWSALMLRRASPELAAFAGFGAAFFAGFQSAIRFQIDKVRRLVSDHALMLASYAVASVGLMLVAADRNFDVTVLGFAVIGAGTAAIVPCGFSLAARRPGLSAGLAISAVSFFGLFPRAPAPLVTGLVADALSLSVAFLGLSLLMLAAMVGVAFFVPREARFFNEASAKGAAE
jgi:hypothetical protein